jgi:nucleoside-diphosphate-sugar epimerase
MVWVTDLAEAMIAAWQAGVPGGRPFIITDGRAYSTRQMYDAIRAALGRSPARRHIPRAVFQSMAKAGDLAGHLLRRRVGFDSLSLERLAGSAEFDCSRAKAELGFSPTKSLYDVVPAMVAAESVP